MVERGLLLKEAIDTWVFKFKEFRSLLLGAAEWATLRQLGDILTIFTKVTKEMSHARQPTLPFVLPVYEQMRVSLEEHARNVTLAPPFRNAAAAGLEKLNQYYSEAKASQYTVIATVLHPSLRVRWFNKLGDGFVTRAEAVFKHAFEDYAASFPCKDPASVPPSDQADTIGNDDDFLLEAISATEDASSSQETTTDYDMVTASELDRYLAGEGGPCQLRMPLVWWRENANRFPIIARMARDFLAIPATSVSVERLFSSSRHLCTDVRASFKATTITEAMCVKHWIRAGLLDIDARPPEPRRTTSVSQTT
ncbi:hypothetical protein BN946_scf184855.g1 [Trametes cinnabarina]|uniref:HAT C-terminal dimerisation domain-containing protein n=1 Tax=Pycnoporus cinnabarinus TaxID=5643 RepID=A0A060SSH2_PYCCI|nr:hypothetical protein BN946_scf184855.g1 [Trametes cinnabarina]